jgi:hypothetical protein
MRERAVVENFAAFEFDESATVPAQRVSFSVA